MHHANSRTQTLARFCRMLGVSTRVQEITQEITACVLTHRQPQQRVPRAMLTVHIFLTARRGANATGGSNERKSDHASPAHPEPSSATAPQSSFPALPSDHQHLHHCSPTAEHPPIQVLLFRGATKRGGRGRTDLSQGGGFLCCFFGTL